MNYYYADAQNQPVGPIAEEQLHELFRSGNITLDSFIIAEGETEWKAYNSLTSSSVMTSCVPDKVNTVEQGQEKITLGIMGSLFSTAIP